MSLLGVTPVGIFTYKITVPGGCGIVLPTTSNPNPPDSKYEIENENDPEADERMLYHQQS